MSDDDMISKTAALEAVKRETGFDDDHPAIAAIAALPAVTPAPDAAAIREAALREALREIGNLGAEFQAGGSPTAVKVLNLAADRINAILALLPKGGA